MPCLIAEDIVAALDPVALSRRIGIDPDRWQARLLRSTSRRKLLNCSRQAGKSTISSVLGLHGALYEPGCLQIILAPSERQSAELLRKVAHALSDLRRTGAAVEMERENVLELEFDNGSRIIALPGKEGTVRGYSGVRRLIIDEASRVPDDLYRAVRPMLAVSGGELDALSTPFGRRGWWHHEWTEGGSSWERFEVPATECPRITPEFLEEERQALPEAWFLQEYCCQFTESDAAIFASRFVEAAVQATGAEVWF